MDVLLLLVILGSIASAGIFLWIGKSLGLVAASAALAVMAVATMAGLVMWIAIPALLILIVTILVGGQRIAYAENASRKKHLHKVMGAISGVAVVAMIVSIIGVSLMGGNGNQDVQAATVTTTVNGEAQSYTASSSSDSIDQKPATDEVIYYAYQAEPGTNNMGPAIHLKSAEDGLARLNEKFKDPLYGAMIVEFDINGENLNQQTVQDRARGYLTNSENRQKDADTFVDNIKSADLIDMGAVQYDSLGMIPDPSGDHTKMPKLTKFSRQPAMEQVLVLHMKSGHNLFLRVACDLQPSVQVFPHVAPPATPEKPATVPPQPYVPPVPPTHTPPKSTPPTTPPTSTPPTTTPPTTTPPTSTPPTTTPPTSTPPTSTPPTKDPSEDPCKTGNAPACQPTDHPVTADPSPSDPAVPESDMPTEPSNPAPPAPSTTEREIPVPSDNQGAPSDDPVTGDPGDSGYTPPADTGGNTGPVDTGGNSGGDDPSKGGSVFNPVEEAPAAPAPQPAPMAPADEPAAPAVQDAPAADVPADDGASAPAADSNTGETVEIENSAFSSSTSDQHVLTIIVMIAFGTLLVTGFLVRPRNTGSKKRH